MGEKITIIEGPTPIFEMSGDAWAMSLNDSSRVGAIAVTRLRTFNGPALVERCHRAWHNHESIQLEYRTDVGLIEHKPIVAARYIDTEEGHMLLLWLRLSESDIEVEIGIEADDGDNDRPDENGFVPPDDRL